MVFVHSLAEQKKREKEKKTERHQISSRVAVLGETFGYISRAYVQVRSLRWVVCCSSIDAFPYNGPGTSNGARPAGRDRVLHAFACRMSASRRKKGRKALTFLVQRLLDDQTVEGLSEEAGGRLSGRKYSAYLRSGMGRWRKKKGGARPSIWSMAQAAVNVDRALNDCCCAGMSVNTKMEHRTLPWVLVINERAWFFSVHLDSRQDRHVEDGLFHCGRLQSRGVKQEHSADKPCFNVFYMFRWNNTVVPGAGWAARTPRAGMNSKKTM